MASRAVAVASSMVLAYERQPGSRGTTTVYPPSASGIKRHLASAAFSTSGHDIFVNWL